MLVIILGGSGFIGQNLCNYLLDIDSDIDIIITTRKKMISHTRRVVYCHHEEIFTYLSNYVGRVVIINLVVEYDRGNNNQLNAIEANLLLPLKIIENLDKGEVDLFINIDTFSRECVHYEDPLFNYSITKGMFASTLRNYSSKIDITNLKLFHVFGEYDNKNKFIPFIINSFLSEIRDLNLTTCDQKRDFIYVNDICKVINKLLRSNNKGYKSLDIGSGKLYSLKYVVETLHQYALTKGYGESTKINYGTIKKYNIEPPEIVAINIIDVDYTPLKSALLKTFDFYEKSYINN